MTFDPARLVRKNIRDLKPYSSARSEFTGEAEVFLDANENAFGSPAGEGFNRYPDPLQTKLKRRIAPMKGVEPSQIFIGNGSDEAIDLLFRIFCEPGRDEVIICPPTYGMYRVSAEINDVAVREIVLTSDFQLDVPAIVSGIHSNTKLIFICSPNNPTGNLMRRESILEIARSFNGIVVIDEAYIDFASEPSTIAELRSLPNIVVLQTFSKAWGMAGLRVGLAFASPEIIELMNRVKPPYNVGSLVQREVIDALGKQDQVAEWTAAAIEQRAMMSRHLADLDFVERVYPSDANFVLVKVADAIGVYRYLVGQRIVVRDRSTVELCEGCLRITVGTAEENRLVIDSFERYWLERSTERAADQRGN